MKENTQCSFIERIQWKKKLSVSGIIVLTLKDSWENTRGHCDTKVFRGSGLLPEYLLILADFWMMTTIVLGCNRIHVFPADCNIYKHMLKSLSWCHVLVAEAVLLASSICYTPDISLTKLCMAVLSFYWAGFCCCCCFAYLLFLSLSISYSVTWQKYIGSLLISETVFVGRLWWNSFWGCVPFHWCSSTTCAGSDYLLFLFSLYSSDFWLVAVFLDALRGNVA